MTSSTLRILYFLQWNDRHGCYTDENCDIEGISPLSYNDALKLFFIFRSERKSSINHSLTVMVKW